MSNISTCEAVELVRNAIDPYSMMGISADDMVYASVKRHMLSLFEKPEGECLHRISFAEFADKVTKTTRIQGEWVDEFRYLSLAMTMDSILGTNVRESEPQS